MATLTGFQHNLRKLLKLVSLTWYLSLHGTKVIL